MDSYMRTVYPYGLSKEFSNSRNIIKHKRDLNKVGVYNSQNVIKTIKLEITIQINQGIISPKCIIH